VKRQWHLTSFVRMPLLIEECGLTVRAFLDGR
jgi:hypothetical protein